MNACLPEESTEVDPVKTAHSASAAVYVLLANASSNPLGLEDWLREIKQAFGVRFAALVAISNEELVAQCFCPRDGRPVDSVCWPWLQEGQAGKYSAKLAPAIPTRSADGSSSFLTMVVPHEGIGWILCLEDGGDRTWSPDEEAALTLAGLGLFQLAPVQKSAQRWVEWSRKVQAQQRLDDAAEVVRHLAHDFNNVLTSVLGFTELSLTQLAPGSPLHGLLTEVYTAAQQGGRLINRLSFFSTRKTVRDSVTASLRQAAEEQEHRLRQAWGDAIALEIQLPPDLPPLSIDVESLRVILGNLFENAREAIDSTGTVRLAARQIELTSQDCLGLLGKARPGGYVEVSVADSGRGFNEFARQRVLSEPFFSTKPRYRGLGLASVYGILSNHGGGIRLEYGAEKGSVVHVYLPCHRRATDVASEGEGEKVGQRGSEKGRDWQDARGTASSGIPSDSSVPAPLPSHSPTFSRSHAG
jgi:signal transduction histidine kinase